MPRDLSPALPGKTGWPWDFTPVQIQAEFDLPRVTIVTPSYNQAEYLEETIRSVLLQGYPNLEYFIMDGSSTDGSVEIIKKYEPWLAGWASEKDKGQSHAINKGFLRSTGEWLGWVNSDDCLAPYALFNLLKTAHDTKSDFIYGACVQFGVSPSVMRFPRMKIPGPRAFDFDVIRMVDAIDQPAALWRREVYEHAGPLAENLHYAFDWDFFIRCARRATASPCARLVAAYRLHQTNKSAALDLRRMEELIGVSLKYLPAGLRGRFMLAVPFIRILKKAALMQIDGAWIWRKIARVVTAVLRQDWILDVFGLPDELRFAHGFMADIEEDIMAFKTAETPAYVVSDSLALFTDAWDISR